MVRLRIKNSHRLTALPPGSVQLSKQFMKNEVFCLKKDRVLKIAEERNRKNKLSE
jgi:hypothetical protein